MFIIFRGTFRRWVSLLLFMTRFFVLLLIFIAMIVFLVFILWCSPFLLTRSWDIIHTRVSTTISPSLVIVLSHTVTAESHHLFACAHSTWVTALATFVPKITHACGKCRGSTWHHTSHWIFWRTFGMRASWISTITVGRGTAVSYKVLLN